MASKILVTGSLYGKIRPAFEKISKLHAKNSFSFGLISGDLFADPANSTPEDEETIDALINGDIEIPLSVYFTVGHLALPPKVIECLEANNGEITTNLFFLGKRSTTKTSEGIRIVTLGGSLDTEAIIGVSKDKYPPLHTESDAKTLHGANSADILLTTNWPTSIRKGSNVVYPAEVQKPIEEQCIADLCATLKPRYHFSSSPDAFFEREPFAHAPSQPGSTSQPITRFISIASSTSTTKSKSLYAFTLDPSAAPPHPLPAGTTPTPLIPSTNKRKQQENNQYSRYGNEGSHRTKKNKHHSRAGPEECFFCLSNPNIATHIITSIATDSYMTTARGPLSNGQTFPQLGFPCHMLLIPLSHSSTMTAIPDTASRKETYVELQKYRQALHKMIAVKGKGQLGALTWEASRGFLRHFHWQFLPVNRSLVDKGLVEAAFKVEAENNKYNTLQKRDLQDGAGEGDYFRLWIWVPKRADSNGTQDENGKPAEGEKEQGREVQLVMSIDAETKFDIQFGRKVMAKLLQLDNRADWKDCGQTTEEEEKDAGAFKETFKEWDFALDDD